MSVDSVQPSRPPQPPWLRILMRVDVMAGLLFIAIAAIGLWVSRDYSIGTAVRMGTGYVPRLMCWILLALGLIILLVGVRGGQEDTGDAPLHWRPLLFIPASQVVFALGIDRLGFVISGLLMIAVAGLASRESRVVEVVVAAAILVLFTWAIFVWALGLTIPVWPD